MPAAARSPRLSSADVSPLRPTTSMKTYTAPDGTAWGVIVQSPGSSNAMILFRHPDGRTSRLDRYNWIISRGPESRSVTSRLFPTESSSNSTPERSCDCSSDRCP